MNKDIIKHYDFEDFKDWAENTIDNYNLKFSFAIYELKNKDNNKKEEAKEIINILANRLENFVNSSFKNITSHDFNTIGYKNYKKAKAILNNKYYHTLKTLKLYKELKTLDKV